MLGVLGLRLVAALTTAGIIAAEAVARHPLHLFDNLRERARF